MAEDGNYGGKNYNPTPEVKEYLGKIFKEWENKGSLERILRNLTGEHINNAKEIMYGIEDASQIGQAFYNLIESAYNQSLKPSCQGEENMPNTSQDLEFIEVEISPKELTEKEIKKYQDAFNKASEMAEEDRTVNRKTLDAINH